LVLVFVLVGAVAAMSPSVAGLVFLLYSGLTGFVFSMIISAYTPGSIASTFAITAGMFGAMALFGFVTKRDLTSLGSILFMALIGFIIASIVNIIWFNETIYWILTGIGIVIFCGLTAWDMQKLKQMSTQAMDDDTADKAAIVGALSLYLDFINLFLLLLRIFGRSR
jgi:FtsH-binding integral membrane protein